MVKSARAWLMMAALVAVGCNEESPGNTPGADAGLIVADSGPVSCEADMANAASTVGCNGGFDGEPALNGPGGRCTPGGDAMPPGTCTTDRAICMGDLSGSGEGWCVILCDAPAGYVDAQTCPTGYRCFRMGEGIDGFGMCFRDCDAEHACQEGWACTGEGRCEELPPA
ncbi:MAG: hypothetical protein M3Y87_04575 [Myxococcota bacterium]|nr:hypothetical protein [Myxococcota bacterium]